MKLSDEFDEINKSKYLVVTIIISTVVVILVLCIVLYSNGSILKRKAKVSNPPVEASASIEGQENEIKTSSTVKVSDLDFYDLYPLDENETSVSTETSVEPEVTDETNDGKHTLIEYPDGKSEWVAISQYLTKHEYDFTNLICQSGIMKYYEDGKNIGYFGVDISKDQDYVDFVKLQKAGADFVMIRVGARGYQSGQLIIDDYFTDNIKRATDAGLDVGVYFVSQAITADEAKEEANLVLESIKDYNVSYPIAYVMEYVENDNCRVEVLSRNDKTTIARAFLNTVKDKGYKPMLYGKKAWLIKYIDLSKVISDYDIWLSQTDKDIPDYPYKFAMWQYNSEGSIEGISGNVNFNISFVDYSIK